MQDDPGGRPGRERGKKRGKDAKKRESPVGFSRRASGVDQGKFDSKRPVIQKDRKNRDLKKGEGRRRKRGPGSEKKGRKISHSPLFKRKRSLPLERPKNRNKTREGRIMRGQRNRVLTREKKGRKKSHFCHNLVI